MKEFSTKNLIEQKQILDDYLDTALSSEHSFSLYQSILEPWLFYIHSSGPNAIDEFAWIFNMGDSDLVDFSSFSDSFANILPLYPCKYHGKVIDKEISLRILYHAFHHPEQYVKDTLTDELDKLLEKYDGWGEGKKT